MAYISLQQMYDAWKRVSDWVSGANSDAPAIKLTGSNVEQTIGGILPIKANLIGISDGANIRAMLGNTSGTLLSSATRTSYTASPNQTNHNAKGVQIILNVTAVGATGGLVVYIKGIDPVAGYAYLLHPQGGITISSAGLYAFELYPGSSGVSSGPTTGNIVQRIAGSLPRTWQAAVGHVDSTSYTYSLGYSLIL